MTADGAHYFTALGGGRYRPTEHTQGAWRPDEQHVAPVIGLLLHVLELEHPRADLQWARVSVDILGVIGRDEMHVTTQVLRPGRTIELVQAEVEIGGRAAVRVTAWRLQRAESPELAGAEADPMPPPEQTPAWDGMLHWGGGFIASAQFRSHGNTPGRGRTWARAPLPLVDTEPVSGLAQWAAVLDTANGSAPLRDPREWMFANVDLTLHLHRLPEGDWTGLDTRVTWGPDGVGLTSSVVHDMRGPVGTLEQALTVRMIRDRP